MAKFLYILKCTSELIGMTNGENLFHLKKFLKGDVRRYVDGML